MKKSGFSQYSARCFRFYPDPGPEKGWQEALQGKKYKAVKGSTECGTTYFDLEFEQKENWNSLIDLLLNCGVIGIDIEKEKARKTRGV